MPDGGALPFWPRALREQLAAAYVGLSGTTFRQLVMPEVPSVKLSPSRRAWLREDLDAWLDGLKGNRRNRVDGGGDDGDGAAPEEFNATAALAAARAAPPAQKGVRAVRVKRADGTEIAYWYCRLTGAKLPDISDPGFNDAVAAARRVPQEKYADGTLGALLKAWRGSQEWARTAESTKAIRDRYLVAIEVPEYATRQVVDLPPTQFRKLRSDLLEVRDMIAGDKGDGAATVFANAVASLFSWAVERGKMVVSPMTKLKAVGGGHIPAWTEADARKAMKAWPEQIRRAVVLNYYIGQRRGDLTMLRWDAYDPAAGVITLQPEKTKRKREAAGKGPLRLIVPSALAWELRKWREEAPEGDFILTRSGGRQWTRGALSMQIREQLIVEKWDTKRGLHGLRKLLAITLKETGSSDGEIGAAQGWDSDRTVRLYTEGADQEKMARAAIDRMEKVLSKAGKTRR